MKEIKILLAKNKFLYYLLYSKEFEILRPISKTLLIFFLLSVTFQSNVFADIKDKAAEEYRLKGYEAQQKGNLEEALSFYAKAVSLSKEGASAALLNDTGVIYEQLGLTDKAQESYLEALKVNGHYLPACSNLAYLYKKQGDTDKAIEYFKKRIEWGEPTDLWTKKAKEELSKLAKDSPKVKKWLSRREATELTDQIIQKEKEDFVNRIIRADEYYEKGQQLAKAGKYEQALDEYTKALSVTPQNPKVIKARNEAKLHLVKKMAKEYSDNALKMLEVGDTASAKIEYRKILTIIPNEPIQISK